MALQSALVPIHVGDGSTTREWLLIELQGEVQLSETRSADDDRDEAVLRQGKTLGKLMNQTTDNPVLIIGNNKLEGKKTKMPKPLAILRKVGKGYECDGLVTQKLVFKTRPKPLTNATAKE